MILNIGKVFKHRTSCWQEVNFIPASLKTTLEAVVVSPVLHGPDRTGVGGERDVTDKIGRDRVRQKVRFALEGVPQSVEDDFLIAPSVLELQLVRGFFPKSADQTEIEPLPRAVGVGEVIFTIEVRTEQLVVCESAQDLGSGGGVL